MGEGEIPLSVWEGRRGLRWKGEGGLNLFLLRVGGDDREGVEFDLLLGHGPQPHHHLLATKNAPSGGAASAPPQDAR